MKKFLLNIIVVALALGSHCSAAQPKLEQSLTSERKALLKKFQQSDHGRKILEHYDWSSEHTWLDDIDYGDKEERPSAPSPSHKQTITAIPNKQELNPAVCSNAINNGEKKPQQPSRLKPALMVGLSTAASLALTGILASHASISDILSPAAAEQASDDCWRNCDDAHARVNNLYFAHRCILGAIASGLASGVTYGVKDKVIALVKKIKSWPKEYAYQAAFEALKKSLDKLYSSKKDTEEQLKQKAIDSAWAFRHATDTLYRAMHPHALTDGIDAAKKFITKHFDEKIQSLKKPQTQHGQFLYGMFMDKVSEIPKNIAQTSEGLQKLVISRTTSRDRELYVAKGNYRTTLKLFHPVDSPTECPIEIEISLNQLKEKAPEDDYQALIAPDVDYKQLFDDTTYWLLYDAERTNDETASMSNIKLAASRIYVFLWTISYEKSSSWQSNYQSIFKNLKRDSLACILSHFSTIYNSFKIELNNMTLEKAQEILRTTQS